MDALPLKHRPSTLRVLRSVVDLLWQTNPTQLMLATASVAVQGIIPVVIAYTAKLIIDHIAASRGATSELWWLLFTEAILVLSMAVMAKWVERFQKVLGEQVQKTLRIRVLAHASNLDLEFFEDPQNFDALSKAQRELGFRPVMMVVALLNTLQGTITLVGFVTIIAAIFPLLLLPVFLSVIPALIFARQSSILIFDLFDRLTPEGRRSAYLETVGTERYFAKEMRLFGLRDWILEHVNTHLEYMMRTRIAVDRTKMQREIISETISMFIGYGALAYVTFLAATNAIGIGTYSLSIGAIASVRTNLIMLINQIGNLLENSLLFADLDRFFSFKSNLYRSDQATPLPREVTTGFRIEDLTFSYPGSRKPIFTGLNLTIRSGQATALVGVNGAGKTTLVKLLTRLYDPSSGRITLDHTDIREYNLEAYRGIFAVLLQDFAQYQISARDNIVLAGKPTSDHISPAFLEQIARDSGALEVIQGLPNTWDTLLGRLFDELGQDLSGGQWQRIALARALYRQAPILILDEPSASLDAEAEAELFERYRQFTKGKLSLLITHRFNTVRFADRIIVLEQGHIVEDGSHSELMRAQGRYFEMFTAQASAYEISS